ncbi:hypothetical protein ACVWWO_006448 [Bradyrhizobium sp. F1.13.1]
MSDPAMRALRRAAQLISRIHGRNGKARFVLKILLSELGPMVRATELSPASPQPAFAATSSALLAENKRLTALVEGRVDKCKARAAFPLDRYDDPQVRRLCRDAHTAKMRGEPYPFDCWKVGKVWWCDKASVDRYLMSILVAPVDFHRVMFAQSKDRT